MPGVVRWREPESGLYLPTEMSELDTKGPGTTALGTTSPEVVPRPVDSGFGVELPLAPSVAIIIASRVPPDQGPKLSRMATFPGVNR